MYTSACGLIWLMILLPLLETPLRKDGGMIVYTDAITAAEYAAALLKLY